MKTINNNDFVAADTIKTYDEIDGLKVIEELLLHKSERWAGDDPKNAYVNKKDLEYMALVLYRLKSNATNNMNVGLRLDEFYLRHGLTGDKQSDRIKVPEEIYLRVKVINDKYRKQ